MPEKREEEEEEEQEEEDVLDVAGRGQRRVAEEEEGEWEGERGWNGKENVKGRGTGVKMDKVRLAWRKEPSHRGCYISSANAVTTLLTSYRKNEPRVSGSTFG